jgi:hypothetical protein
VITAVGYDEVEQVLEIAFRTGRVYRYARVPPEVHQELRRAASVGRYFNDNIRDRYSSTLLL